MSQVDPLVIRHKTDITAKNMVKRGVGIVRIDRIQAVLRLATTCWRPDMCGGGIWVWPDDGHCEFVLGDVWGDMFGHVKISREEVSRGIDAGSMVSAACCVALSLEWKDEARYLMRLCADESYLHRVSLNEQVVRDPEMIVKHFQFVAGYCMGLRFGAHRSLSGDGMFYNGSLLMDECMNWRVSVDSLLLTCDGMLPEGVETARDFFWWVRVMDRCPCEFTAAYVLLRWALSYQDNACLRGAQRLMELLHPRCTSLLHDVPRYVRNQ
jgi:hypothetical protein